MQRTAQAKACAMVDHEPCYRDSDLTVTPMGERAGVWVSGAIDASNAEFVAAARNAAAVGANEVFVDASGLLFADVAGVRALIEPAERSSAPVAVVLLDPPPILERVLALGWGRPLRVEIRRA